MDWQRFLFGGWAPIARTAIVGVLAYVVLIVLVRISGKRTLSKFSAYDFVITVALGSSLASILVSRDVALAQGVAAIVVLLALQFGITWVSVRSERVRGVVRGIPTLLLYRGAFLEDVLRRERVTHEEIDAAAREQGVSALAEVEAAVLETDGTISIVRHAPEGRPSSLDEVRGYPPGGDRPGGG
ncbi:MAG TPA: YetF domain-containing protein [Gemmatimonadales bacterium]